MKSSVTPSPSNQLSHASPAGTIRRALPKRMISTCFTAVPERGLLPRPGERGRDGDLTGVADRPRVSDDETEVTGARGSTKLQKGRCFILTEGRQWHRSTAIPGCGGAQVGGTKSISTRQEKIADLEPAPTPRGGRLRAGVRRICCQGEEQRGNGLTTALQPPAGDPKVEAVEYRRM